MKPLIFISAIFVTCALLWRISQPKPQSLTPIEQGRRIYIAEGCIHCHSQYIRPDCPQDLPWGEPTPLAESLSQLPVLIGNRRQGPDLSQVGERRDPSWNRAHLINPQAITPGSRMPPYAHLFASGNKDGEYLLRYLDSLRKTPKDSVAPASGL